MFPSSYRRTTLAILTVILMGITAQAHAQTIDCDAPAPTTPTTITSARPYGVSFCIPSTVMITNPDSTTDVVQNRVDGYFTKLDTNAEVNLPVSQVTTGTPSPNLKLIPVSFRTSSGVPKGQHQIAVQAYNFPLNPDGTPNTTGTPQRAAAVIIPFVATDAVLSGAPPPIQKGRIVR